MIKYTDYITSEHKKQERFFKTVEFSCEPYQVLNDLLMSLIDGFDVDLAVGKQLDILGEWVGQSRYLKVPLQGVYLEWTEYDQYNPDGSVVPHEGKGWDECIWVGEYEDTNTMYELDDDTYRSVIKMKAIMNHWLGNANSAYDTWKIAFPNNGIIIEDHQDMSIDIGVTGHISEALKGYLLNNSIFKPESVKMNIYYLMDTYDSDKFFGWDIESDAVGGWDQSQWAAEFKFDGE